MDYEHAAPCGAPAGVYCEERPGKVLFLTRHHVERFWAAGAINVIINEERSETARLFRSSP